LFNEDDRMSAPPENFHEFSTTTKIFRATYWPLVNRSGWGKKNRRLRTTALTLTVLTVPPTCVFGSRSLFPLDEVVARAQARALGFSDEVFADAASRVIVNHKGLFDVRAR
jgi:hypothetical protein